MPFFLSRHRSNHTHSNRTWLCTYTSLTAKQLLHLSKGFTADRRKTCTVNRSIFHLRKGYRNQIKRNYNDRRYQRITLKRRKRDNKDKGVNL